MHKYTDEEIGSAIAELILLQHYFWEHPNEDVFKVIKKRIEMLTKKETFKQLNTMTEIKTLSERLKPEYALILETDVKQEYPAIYQSINKALNEKYFINNLTIDEAEHMVLYVYDGNRDLNNIYKMFVI